MKKTSAKVIWITGLSGSGKSTIAREITYLLKQNGKNVILLDGDDLRKIFQSWIRESDKYNAKNRYNLGMSYSKLCKQIASQGTYVVIATISMFHKIHEWNRKNLPGYFEVFLDVPINELQKRDTKKLYKNIGNGVISEVVGLDIPAEKPLSPDIIIEFNKKKNITDIVNELMISLREQNE